MDVLQLLVLYLNVPVVLLLLHRADMFLYNEEALLQVVVQLYQQADSLECFIRKYELVLA